MSDALKELLPEQLRDYFEYLDDLRESGKTNMFGAGPYLQHEFLLDRAESYAVLAAWQKTFSKEPASTRVLEALEDGVEL